MRFRSVLTTFRWLAFRRAYGLLSVLLLAAAGCERPVAGDNSRADAAEEEKPLVVRAEAAQRRTIVEAVYGLG